MLETLSFAVKIGAALFLLVDSAIAEGRGLPTSIALASAWLAGAFIALP